MGKLKFPRLPVITFSSNIHTFGNQIANRSLQELERNQEIVLEFVRDNLLPGVGTIEPRIVVHEISQNVDLSPTIQLEVEALNIEGSNIKFNNVDFKIVNGDVDLVEVSAEIILGVNYEGIDHQIYQQEQMVPFFTTINLLNDFPDAAVVEGDLKLDNLTITYDLDPSINAIVSVTSIVYLEIVARISLQVSGD